MTDSKMPKRETGRHIRKGSKVEQFVQRVPADLRDLYPGKRYACRKSLGTRDPKEANRLSLELRAQWASVFDEQRRQRAEVGAQNVSARPESITPEVAALIAKTLRRNVLAVDEDLRKNPKKWSVAGTDRERLFGMPGHLSDSLAETNRETEALLARAVAKGEIRYALPSVQYAAEALGLTIDAETPGALELLSECLNVLRQAVALCVKRDQGDVVETPPMPAPAVAKKVYRLRDVFTLWKASKASSLAPDTVRSREIALELYEQFSGNPNIEEITRLQGDEFRAWLIAKGGALKTAHDRFTYVKSLFAYAHRELDVIPRHPWYGLDIAYVTENERSPWSPTAIGAFFALPLFQNYDLPQKQARAGADAAYWIPLLGLFSGARVGELCQLEVADIIEQDGVWAFHVNDKSPGKRVKTPAAVRMVPIHSQLIRLGFLDYAKAVKEGGHVRLWPALRLLEGKPSHAFSAWFNEVAIKRVTELAVPDFHSLRHTISSLLARRRVPESDRNLILGHEQTGSEGNKTYLHVDLPHLQEVVERIQHDSFSLARAYIAGTAPTLLKQRMPRRRNISGA